MKLRKKSNTVEQFCSEVTVGFHAASSEESQFLSHVAVAVSVIGISTLLYAKFGPKCNRSCKALTFVSSAFLFSGVVGIIIELQEKGSFLNTLSGAGLKLEDCTNCFRDITICCPYPCYELEINDWLSY